MTGTRLMAPDQSGLFQAVKDISIAELRANTVKLAQFATLLKVPVITRASEQKGSDREQSEGAGSWPGRPVRAPRGAACGRKAA